MRIGPIAIALVFLAVPAQAAAVRIALLPLAVHAAGEESSYLQSGLAEMIAARLDQYEDVVVVRQASSEAPPADIAAARETAEAEGADFVLYGSFTRFGDGASLDMRCAEVVPGEAEEASARRIFIQSGSLAEIIPQLDTLAQKVVRYAFGAGGGAPRVAGAADGKAGSGGAGPSSREFKALSDRVDAIETALFPPIASGENAPAGPPAPDGDAELVR